MSTQKIQELRQALTTIGLVENEDFTVVGNGFGLTFTVELDPDLEELPEVLKPFEWDSHQVERAMLKGNGTKQTWNGANFELALRDYAQNVFNKEPELQALEATIKTIETPEDLRAYQARRTELWKQVCARPEIATLEAKLDEYL